MQDNFQALALSKGWTKENLPSTGPSSLASKQREFEKENYGNLYLDSENLLIHSKDVFNKLTKSPSLFLHSNTCSIIAMLACWLAKAAVLAKSSNGLTDRCSARGPRFASVS